MGIISEIDANPLRSQMAHILGGGGGRDGHTNCPRIWGQWAPIFGDNFPLFSSAPTLIPVSPAVNLIYTMVNCFILLS